MHELSDNDEGTGFNSRRLVLVVVVLGMVLGLGGIAWATKWSIVLKSGSAGAAKAQAAPAAPTGVSAACTSSSAETVKVSWTAVTRATTYTVYDATTSATGTYARASPAVSRLPLGQAEP